MRTMRMLKTLRGMTLAGPQPAGRGLALAVLLTACLGLAGCAIPGGLLGVPDKAPPFRDPALSMQAAQQLLVPGQSTRAEVLAALGQATVVWFDSRFEVWVYRDKPASNPPSSANAEFVILFTPSGVVKKTRIRPAYGLQG